MGVSTYYCCICDECINENYIPFVPYIDEKSGKRLFKKYGEYDLEEAFKCKKCKKAICVFCIASSINQKEEKSHTYTFIDKAIKKYCKEEINKCGKYYISDYICSDCSSIVCPHCKKKICN